MEREMKERIQQGKVTKEDVIRRLAELAFARSNDCVTLVLAEKPQLSRLDLSLLSEVKRNEKGLVEIKLLDRLKVLQQLAEALGGDDSGAEEFLRALAPEQEML